MRNFTKEEIENAIKQTSSMSAAARFLNTRIATFKKYADLYDLYRPNQSGEGVSKLKGYIGDVFVNGKYETGSTLKRRLLKERPHRCEDCLNLEWKGNPIALEVHHKDGDSCNNTRDNLILLCPNCHSCTPNWRGKNINTGNKVEDEELISALKDTPSIRQALIKVGLAPKGGNYKRAYQLLSELTSA